MAASTFQDWYDPDGIDAAQGVGVPRAPKPRVATPNWNPVYDRWAAAGYNQRPQQPQRPIIANTAAPAPVNYAAQQSQWMNQMQQRMTQPAVQPVASKPASTAKSSAPPMTSGQSRGQKDEPAPQQTQVAYQQPAQGNDNMIGQLHAQHFGQHNNMVAGVNAAMSGAAKQWSDAAARNQAFQQRQAEANQASQMEMAKMQSQERMNQAEMQDRKEKRKAIMGMMGGFTPIGRSLLG
jgi:hypothetical protein